MALQLLPIFTWKIYRRVCSRIRLRTKATSLLSKSNGLFKIYAREKVSIYILSDKVYKQRSLMKESRAQSVLRKLLEAGEKGVFSFDLFEVGGSRYAARILDLKKKGYSIFSRFEKRGRTAGCRYFVENV